MQTTHLYAPGAGNRLLLAAIVFGLVGLAIASSQRPRVEAQKQAPIIILATRAPAVRDKPIEPQAAPTVAPTAVPTTEPASVAAPPTAAPEVYRTQAAPAPEPEAPAEAWEGVPFVLPLSEEQSRQWANMPEGWHPPMALPPVVQCVQTRGGGMCVEEQP